MYAHQHRFGITDECDSCGMSAPDPTTWDPCDVCRHMMPDYERTPSEINTATGHVKCIHAHDRQLVATSALGACLCTSFTRNIVTDACKVCGHESHASRVHCGVMVDA